MEVVKIFVNLKSDLLVRTFNAILPYVVDVEIVLEEEKAQIVICDEARTLFGNFKYEKEYLFLKLPSKDVTIKRDNVTIISYVGLKELAEAIALAKKNLGEKIAKVTPLPMIKEKPGLPWILIIDDKQKNLAAAISQLNDKYNLVVANGYDSGMALLNSKQFDFVLSDLFMPVATSNAMSDEAIMENSSKDIPYGLLLLIESCRHGAHATIVTDLSHHSDPLSAAFDGYSGKPIIINDKVALIQHALLKVGSVKDWTAALNKIKTYSQK